MKTYSAESGYVYQYFYRGCRAAGETAEYVFQTSADRKNWFPVTVVMPSSSVADFNLSPTERYAVAKMALFQAFNERANPAAMQKPVQIRPSDAATILELLGRD
ncbi:MAG: hypothetical protein IT160_12405 [Bryobacterales bacterium]|nr:hypothetical protein [Bryobacterales bacterium]